jgi:hypothetical protein
MGWNDDKRLKAEEEAERILKAHFKVAKDKQIAREVAILSVSDIIRIVSPFGSAIIKDEQFYQYVREAIKFYPMHKLSEE